MIYKNFVITQTLNKESYFAELNNEYYLFNNNTIDVLSNFSTTNISKLCYFKSIKEVIDTIDYIYKYNPEELL